MVNLIAAPVDQLRVQVQFPYQVNIQPDIKIPLPDGSWLHARAWIPECAAEEPVPALVEYAPFRHRDFTAPRDALIHPWFAGHGYACLRIELRGSGDSGGMPQDEYVIQEQDDAMEALEWVSKQPWCDGSTGMFGMSWGAFSALQVAARQPASLKAIIPVHGTDDRFTDDIHYKGGCLLTAGLSWGTLSTLYMMRPPDPELSGEFWRQRWLERFDGCPLVLSEWMSHQYRDSYWRHGSISEDYAKLTCPVLVVCGWADGYTNAAMRMAEQLPECSQVLIGPWAHTYPHLARPGPQGDFLQEALKWWDRWLKGIDNKVESQPRVRLWLQDSALPASSYHRRNGQWLAFKHWPCPDISGEIWNLQPGQLEKSCAVESSMFIKTPLANAITGPEWLPHGVGPELPVDQQSEDDGSLCFDSPVLDTELVICGAAVLKLRLRSDKAQGIVYARLVDLLPDGEATQISYGVLNLAHGKGLDQPAALDPGRWIDMEIRLNDIAQRIPVGHRLRISVSTQAWPLVWTAPEVMTLELLSGRSQLILPLLNASSIQKLEITPPGQAVIPEPLLVTWLRDVKRERIVKTDRVTNTVSRSYLKDDGAYRIEEHGMEVDSSGCLTYRCQGEDPLTAEAEYQYQLKQTRGEWHVSVESEIQITADQDFFYVTGEYRALENKKVIRRRAVDITVRREFV